MSNSLRNTFSNSFRIMRVLGVAALSMAIVAVYLVGLAEVSLAAPTAKWTVCSSGCDFKEIQAAIDAADHGDILQIRDESFSEHLVITKSLTLEGGYEAGFTNRNPRTTVIMGVGLGRLVRIEGEGLNVTLDGFEITNGAYPGDGAGIYINLDDDGQVVINDNFIHDNVAINGGGIYADIDNRGYLAITKNDVMTNTATENYGGIYADNYFSSTLTLIGNEIQ